MSQGRRTTCRRRAVPALDAVRKTNGTAFRSKVVPFRYVKRRSAIRTWPESPNDRKLPPGAPSVVPQVWHGLASAYMPMPPMPCMPPPPPPGIFSFFSLISPTMASVVSSRAATDAAF